MSETDTDLWARVLWDFHQGLPAVYGIRRDDGLLEDDHSPEVYFSEPAEFFPWEAGPLEAARGPVLDVGAGTGRMTLWAQGRGLEVVAIESLPRVAELARARGAVDVRVGRWEDLNRLLAPEERSFASVFLMGHNLGLGGTLPGLAELLRSLHAVSRPGAALIATSIAFTATDDTDRLRFQEAQRDRGRYPGELVIRVEYQGRVGPYFPWLLVEPDDLARVGRTSGWFLEQVAQSEDAHYGAVLRRLGQ